MLYLWVKMIEISHFWNPINGKIHNFLGSHFFVVVVVNITIFSNLLNLTLFHFLQHCVSWIFFFPDGGSLTFFLAFLFFSSFILVNLKILHYFDHFQ